MNSLYPPLGFSYAQRATLNSFEMTNLKPFVPTFSSTHSNLFWPDICSVDRAKTFAAIRSPNGRNDWRNRPCPSWPKDPRGLRKSLRSKKSTAPLKVSWFNYKKMMIKHFLGNFFPLSLTNLLSLAYQETRQEVDTITSSIYNFIDSSNLQFKLNN